MDSMDRIPMNELLVTTGCDASASYIMGPGGEAFPEPMVILEMRYATVDADYDDTRKHIYVLEPDHAAELVAMLMKMATAAKKSPHLKES